MNNDTNFTLIMLEFEKLTTKLDKLEKELAEFKQLVYPSQNIVTNFGTNSLIVGEQSDWSAWFTPLSSNLKGETYEH